MPAELDSAYRISHISAAPEVGPATVLEFWVREGAMPEAVARERVSEVAFVALHSNELVGVSTVYLRADRRLRCDLWHFRTFVASAHRRWELATWLLRATRLRLTEEFESGRDTRGLGIMIEVENPQLRRERSEAVWEHPESPGVRYVFVGENERGEPRRVHWFPGARAPLP